MDIKKTIGKLIFLKQMHQEDINFKVECDIKNLNITHIDTLLIKIRNVLSEYFEDIDSIEYRYSYNYNEFWFKRLPQNYIWNLLNIIIQIHIIYNILLSLLFCHYNLIL